MGFLMILKDFANIFKAFIGVNYLQIAFAFKESGLYLGLIGVLGISFATVHCCALIVKCKKEVVRMILKDPVSLQGRLPQTVLQADPEDIEKHLEYGDIARAGLGETGSILTNIALFVTQFGFCVGYFIFLGNTIEDIIFPVAKCKENGTVAPPGNESEEIEITYDYVETETVPWRELVKSCLPDEERYTTYLYLVLIPFPFFLIFALIRSIRSMGLLSLLANFSVLVGYLSIFTHILEDFKVAEDIKPYSFATFPIFFGQVTSAYEGIGTIIPIESSMEGSRSIYPLLLYLALLLFTFVYASMGVIGYLRYGSQVQQVIIWSLPEGSLVSLITNVTICLGVALTFPLQNYVIVELVEGFIWGSGIKEAGSEKKPSSGQVQGDLKEPLLAGEASENESGDEVQDIKYTEVKVSWLKRSLLRIFLVIIQLAIAMTLKDEFAYFTAFIGAIGSTMLAYILPCLIHISLKRDRMSSFILCKDIFFILFGLVGMVAGVYCSVREIVIKLKG